VLALNPTSISQQAQVTQELNAEHEQLSTFSGWLCDPPSDHRSLRSLTSQCATESARCFLLYVLRADPLMLSATPSIWLLPVSRHDHEHAVDLQDQQLHGNIVSPSSTPCAKTCGELEFRRQAQKDLGGCLPLLP
jgi:hypothetical protein